MKLKKKDNIVTRLKTYVKFSKIFQKLNSKKANSKKEQNFKKYLKDSQEKINSRK